MVLIEVVDQMPSVRSSERPHEVIKYSESTRCELVNVSRLLENLHSQSVLATLLMCPQQGLVHFFNRLCKVRLLETAAESFHVLNDLAALCRVCVKDVLKLNKIEE